MIITEMLLAAAKKVPLISRPIVAAVSHLIIRVGPQTARHRPHWFFKQLVRDLYIRLPVPAQLPNGMKILVPWCDQVGADLLTGTFEKETVYWLQRLVKPGMTVLDIGAHVGIYSLLMSDLVGEKGKVCCFEAEPKLAGWLVQSARSNQRTNIEVNVTVLSEVEGEVVFFRANDASVNSLVPPRSIYGYEAIRLPSTRLDRYIRDKGLSDIGLIKIDIEGAELQTLKTITWLLRSSARPMLIVEFAESRGALRDLADFLKSCGYDLYRMGENLFPFEPGDLGEPNSESPQPAFNALAISPGQVIT